MCALQDNAARYLRARARPVLVSCEESQRVEISLSRSLTPSPLVTCTCICPVAPCQRLLSREYHIPINVGRQTDKYIVGFFREPSIRRIEGSQCRPLYIRESL